MNRAEGRKQRGVWFTTARLLWLGGWLLLCVACRKEDPWLARVQEAGVLRVGMDPSWPPFEYVDPAQGEIVGLDVDLAREIGERLGVGVILVPSGWEGLYDALLAGQFDAVISALPYDPWRTEEVRYSISYFDAGPAITAHPGGGIAGTEDLEGRTVHVEFGSEGDVQARRLAKGMPDLEIVPHDTADEALAGADADPAAAAIVDAVSARLWIREHGTLQVVGERLYEEPYVIAVHARAASLQEAIDAALIEMRESGELEALRERWM
jgi:polar amino acid transport system substrate-binding protein